MERKLATVLFVDLVESTRLLSASDPEIVRRRVTRFFQQVSRCIEHHARRDAGSRVLQPQGTCRVIV